MTRPTPHLDRLLREWEQVKDLAKGSIKPMNIRAGFQLAKLLGDADFRKRLGKVREDCGVPDDARWISAGPDNSMTDIVDFIASLHYESASSGWFMIAVIDENDQCLMVAAIPPL